MPTASALVARGRTHVTHAAETANRSRATTNIYLRSLRHPAPPADCIHACPPRRTTVATHAAAPTTQPAHTAAQGTELHAVLPHWQQPPETQASRSPSTTPPPHAALTSSLRVRAPLAWQWQTVCQVQASLCASSTPTPSHTGPTTMVSGATNLKPWALTTAMRLFGHAPRSFSALNHRTKSMNHLHYVVYASCWLCATTDP